VNTQRAAISSEWRDAIGGAVEAAYPQAPFTSPDLKAARFTVEVTFRMTPLDLARPAVDLDNFVKPVLDTLFTRGTSGDSPGSFSPTWTTRGCSDSSSRGGSG